MENLAIFGLVMLGIIGIVFQHLSNWFVRLSNEDPRDDMVVGFILLTLITQIFSFVSFYILISQIIKIY